MGDKSSSGLLNQGEQSEPLFPHLYGTIDFDSVVEELPVQRSEEGAFLSITGL